MNNSGMTRVGFLAVGMLVMGLLVLHAAPKPRAGRRGVRGWNQHLDAP